MPESQKTPDIKELIAFWKSALKALIGARLQLRNRKKKNINGIYKKY